MIRIEHIGFSRKQRGTLLAGINKVCCRKPASGQRSDRQHQSSREECLRSAQFRPTVLHFPLAQVVIAHIQKTRDKSKRSIIAPELSNVDSEWFGDSPCGCPLQCLRKALIFGAVWRSIQNQRKHAMLATELLERVDFLIDPFRPSRTLRTENDEHIACLKRRFDPRSKLSSRRKFFFVAENFAKSLFSSCSNEPARYAVAFESAVQPHCPLMIGMRVRQESAKGKTELGHAAQLSGCPLDPNSPSKPKPDENF